MKIKAIAELGIKLLGVYCALQFLAILPTAFSVHEMQNEMERALWEFEADGFRGTPVSAFSRIVLGTTQTAFLYLLFAIVLPFMSPRIASWLVKDDQEVSFDLTSDQRERLLRFVIQLAGLYALITWLPVFVETLVRTMIFGTWQFPQISFFERFYHNWSVLIAPFVGTMLGLILLLGSAGMIRVIQLARPMHRSGDADS
jgi:hypothetical protein